MGCCESEPVAPPAPKSVTKTSPVSLQPPPQPEPTIKRKAIPVTQDSGPKPLDQADINTKVIAQRTPIGVLLEAGKTYYYCTCGRSTSQPYCDGKHYGTPFIPMPFVPERSEQVYMCCCKASFSEPRCDGSHLNLKW